MKRYACSLDKFAKVIPWLVPGMVIFGTTMAVVEMRVEGAHMMIFTSIVPLLILSCIFFITRLFKIGDIVVDENSITIERKLKPVTINFADIISIKRMDNMQYAIRTFGNGGMFGYTGKYYKKGIGSMTWYCTQRKNYILIEKTDEKKMLITPDDPDGFLSDIEQRYPLLVAGTTE